MIKLSIKYLVLSDSEFEIARFEEDVPTEIIKSLAIARDPRAHFDPSGDPTTLHTVKTALHEMKVLTAREADTVVGLFNQRIYYEEAMKKIRGLGVLV